MERPDSLTVEGFWALRNNFFAYTISFFGLGSMLIIIHNEWLYVQKISSKTSGGL
ncbi:hypothetical protein NKE61_02225 [Streptococcus suis]|uniref:hypothetical protein n=1 Tax=Streptococcus suis TaxID=1307 RepID=UPI00209A9970|nr:hypothetical protein [Streptococcus suis]MCO8174355.1 hypothetical protein [Streptococcus suis]MCO8208755.1 hypothetical protein [Streptococcus suis]